MPKRSDQNSVESELSALRARVSELEIRLAESVQDADLLRILMDAIPDTIFFKDRSSRFVRVNKAVADLIGVDSRSQVIGHTDADYYSEAFSRETLEDERVLIETSKPMLNKLEQVTLPDGRFQWYTTTKIPLYGADGTVTGIAGISRNVTEHVEMLDALRRSEERYQVLFDKSQSLIFVHDMDGVIRLVNTATTTRLGYASENLVGAYMGNYLDAGDRAAIPEYLEEIKKNGVAEGSLNVITESGALLEWAFRSHTYRETSGELLVLGNAMDITLLRKAEEALKQSEDRYRLIFEGSQEGVFFYSFGGAEQVVNNRLAEMCGYTTDELIHIDLLRIVHPDDLSRVQENNLRRLRGEEFERSYEFRLIHKAGHVIDVEGTFEAIRDNNIVIGVCGIIRDITEKKRAESALRASEERYRLIFQGTRDGIVFISTDGRREVLNRQLAEMYGYTVDELRSKPALSMIHPDDLPRLTENNSRRLAGESFDQTYEFRGVHKDGHVIYFEGTFDAIKRGDEVIGVCGILRDISERKRSEEERNHLQQQLLHTQKLESLGVLAGGIAHDFNNLLVAVLGNTDLALMDLPEQSPARPLLEEVRKAGVRAADLCRQMLAYSGKGRFVVEPLDLNDLVQEMTHLLEVSISKKAHLTYNFFDDLPTIIGDATQIRQIIMNLITNASEALGDHGGAISISTGLAQLRREDLSGTYLNENLPEGSYVYIEVTDTGCGMTEETLARLFDPFFSTKFTGRGLGMAVVLGIVRGHKGTIRIKSNVGEGTTYRVYLPCSDDAAPHEQVSRISEMDKWRCSGTILVIDDEAGVRSVSKMALEKHGFNVVMADGGRAGLNVFSEMGHSVDLVLLDLTMPDMSGEETLAELRRIRHDVRVILTSGYSEYEASAHLKMSDISGFVQKPFHVAALISMVRKALDV